ncbi:MAG: hypothetical protein ACFFEV_02810 [Candidatus Thorarchaeota archaeon]
MEGENCILDAYQQFWTNKEAHLDCFRKAHNFYVKAQLLIDSNIGEFLHGRYWTRVVNAIAILILALATGEISAAADYASLARQKLVDAVSSAKDDISESLVFYQEHLIEVCNWICIARTYRLEFINPKNKETAIKNVRNGYEQLNKDRKKLNERLPESGWRFKQFWSLFHLYIIVYLLRKLSDWIEEAALRDMSEGDGSQYSLFEDDLKWVRRKIKYHCKEVRKCRSNYVDSVYLPSTKSREICGKWTEHFGQIKLQRIEVSIALHNSNLEQAYETQSEIVKKITKLKSMPGIPWTKPSWRSAADFEVKVLGVLELAKNSISTDDEIGHILMVLRDLLLASVTFVEKRRWLAAWRNQLVVSIIWKFIETKIVNNVSATTKASIKDFKHKLEHFVTFSKVFYQNDVSKKIDESAAVSNALRGVKKKLGYTKEQILQLEAFADIVDALCEASRVSVEDEPEPDLVGKHKEVDIERELQYHSNARALFKNAEDKFFEAGRIDWAMWAQARGLNQEAWYNFKIARRNKTNLELLITEYNKAAACFSSAASLIQNLDFHYCNIECARYHRVLSLMNYRIGSIISEDEFSRSFSYIASNLMQESGFQEFNCRDIREYCTLMSFSSLFIIPVQFKLAIKILHSDTGTERSDIARSNYREAVYHARCAERYLEVSASMNLQLFARILREFGEASIIQLDLVQAKGEKDDEEKLLQKISHIAQHLNEDLDNLKSTATIDDDVLCYLQGRAYALCSIMNEYKALSLNLENEEDFEKLRDYHEKAADFSNLAADSFKSFNQDLSYAYTLDHYYHKASSMLGSALKKIAILIQNTDQEQYISQTKQDIDIAQDYLDRIPEESYARPLAELKNILIQCVNQICEALEKGIVSKELLDDIIGKIKSIDEFKSRLHVVHVAEFDILAQFLVEKLSDSLQNSPMLNHQVKIDNSQLPLLVEVMIENTGGGIGRDVHLFLDLQCFDKVGAKVTPIIESPFNTGKYLQPDSRHTESLGEIESKEVFKIPLSLNPINLRDIETIRVDAEIQYTNHTSQESPSISESDTLEKPYSIAESQDDIILKRQYFKLEKDTRISSFGPVHIEIPKSESEEIWVGIAVNNDTAGVQNHGFGISGASYKDGIRENRQRSFIIEYSPILTDVELRGSVEKDGSIEMMVWVFAEEYVTYKIEIDIGG